MNRLIVDPRHIREIARAQRELLEIVADLVDEVPSIVGHLWTTRIWSSPNEEARIMRDIKEKTGKDYKTSGIHTVDNPIRAWDIAPAPTVDDTMGKEIADAVNSRWIYDYGRPNMKCVLYHMGHWHVQVHPRTRRNKEFKPHVESDHG
ncbi:MAG: hypothetical protein Q9M76_04465 [Candidatus Dojkabacteria bacterium]|nr:hypothetical protein [Candidatus Dojkabacteria bacterium]